MSIAVSPHTFSRVSSTDVSLSAPSSLPGEVQQVPTHSPPRSKNVNFFPPSIVFLPYFVSRTDFWAPRGVFRVTGIVFEGYLQPVCRLPSTFLEVPAAAYLEVSAACLEGKRIFVDPRSLFWGVSETCFRGLPERFEVICNKVLGLVSRERYIK